MLKLKGKYGEDFYIRADSIIGFTTRYEEYVELIIYCVAGHIFVFQYDDKKECEEVKKEILKAIEKEEG